MHPHLTDGDFTQANGDFVQRNIECPGNVTVGELAGLPNIEHGEVVGAQGLGKIGEVRDPIGP